MQVAIPKERAPYERRTAMVPEVAQRLIDAGHTIAIEQGTGDAANYPDELYTERGVEVLDNVAELLGHADVVCSVSPLGVEQANLVRSSAATVSFFQPQQNLDVLESLNARGVSVFSLDLVPRISRAQSMDALSSQATVSGYKAVLIAANRISKFFPMFMTAAGTIPPAKVLILGVGVAGLQAIATARRLGASVRANDIRPSSKDEVQSLGATFVELPIESQEGSGGYAREQSEDFLVRQREMIAREVAAATVVITTAAVPGRAAPLLVTTAMVEGMAPGSMIVDLAAESGGNCELSVAGEEILHGGVIVHGVRNLPSSMSKHASFLYARNVAEFVGILGRDGQLAPNFDDEIIASCCIAHDGQIRHEPTIELLKERSA